MPVDFEQLLGAEAKGLLSYRSNTVPKEALHLPGPDFVDRVLAVPSRRDREMPTSFQTRVSLLVKYAPILAIQSC